MLYRPAPCRSFATTTACPRKPCWRRTDGRFGTSNACVAAEPVEGGSIDSDAAMPDVWVFFVLFLDLSVVCNLILFDYQ